MHRKTYTRLLAICLLLLYGFITVPVSYWHHHHDKTTHEDCKICEHKYAAYHNDGITPVIVFHPAVFIACSVLRPSSIISIPAFNCSNKSPPAFSSIG